MASLVGQQLKDTYDSLLKTSDNDALSGTYKEITDGSGNGSNLYLGTGGNVGIGGSPSQLLHLKKSGTPVFQITDTQASGKYFLTGVDTNNTFLRTDASILFQVGGTTERMKINGSSGDISFRDGSANEAFYWDASTARLGLGTTSPDTILELDGGTSYEHLKISASGNTSRFMKIGMDSATEHTIEANGSSSFLTFKTTTSGGVTSEAMRIDSSGNVHISRTTDDQVTDGISLNERGLLRTVRTDADSATFHRLNSDGDIVLFRKDSTTVGSIGTRGGEITFHQGDTGIRLRSGTDNIIPVDASGAGRSNAIDIGSSSEKFKDLYLGGSVYLGGTTSANALDDYEEGTWTPVYTPQTGSFTTMTMDIVSATYTKIGRQVTVRAYLRTDNVDTTGASGELRIGGLPFTSASSNGGWSPINIGFTDAWSTSPDNGYVRDGSTLVTLRKTDGTTALNVSDLTTGASSDKNVLIVNVTYFV